MRDFFRSGKRKLGCVILVMAVSLAAIWIANPVCFDAIPRDFGIAFETDEMRVTARCVNTIHVVHTSTVEAADGSRTQVARQATQTSIRNALNTTLPYSYLVSPLTVLAAWLLLSKPKQPVKHA